MLIAAPAVSVFAPSSLSAELKETCDFHEVAEQVAGKVSYGMYVGGLKAGFRVENIYVSKEDPDILVEEITQEMSFCSGKGKRRKDFVWSEKSLTRSSLKDGLIFEFEMKERTLDREKTIRAVREEDHYNVTTKFGDKVHESKYGIFGNYLIDDYVAFMDWLTSNPAPGSTLLFDGNSFTVKDGRAISTMTFAGKFPSKKKDQESEYYVERIDHTQDKHQQWYDKRGRLTRSLSGRFELRQEDDQTALKYDPPQSTELSRIPIDERLEEAQLEKMVVVLRNSSAISLHVDHRQRIENTYDGNRYVMATICRDYETKQPEPIVTSDKKKYLAATKRIQASDPKIHKLAKEILKSKMKIRSAKQKAEVLQKWVFENIEKRQSIDVPTALEVLEKRRGDCTEHALLLVALLRSSGVPAREVHGLVYSDRKNSPAFAGHRWVEFHDGHQWVSVDPTIGKVYVPATYISFGPDTPVVYELLGLSIKVLKTQAEIDNAKP